MYFYVNFVYSNAGYNETMQEWYSQIYGFFNYIYRIDVNIEWLKSCWNKQLSSNNILSSYINILSSNNKPKQHNTLKSKQQSMTSCRCKYNALYNL